MTINQIMKNRINEYYKPELEKIGENYIDGIFTIKINGFKQSFNITDKRILYLAFGEKCNSAKEAKEKGFFCTTPHELFVTFFPERWERIQHKFQDDRTERYLQAIEKNIGFIRSIGNYDEEEFATSYNIPGPFGYTQTSPIKIGITKKNEWCAQYTQRTNIDDYVIVKMYFEKEPTLKAVQTVDLIQTIRDYFNFGRYDRVYFNCWECGRRVHWLNNVEGDLFEKWDKFKDKYCGC